MEETFTEYQVRMVLAEAEGLTEMRRDELVQRMREAPARPGVGGFSDDELKGTARDA